jgi:twitching motility protein PilT
MEITELLAFGRKNKASDLHLASERPPMLRINGDITPLRVGVLSADEVLAMIYSLMTEKQRAEYEDKLELDFAVHFGDESRYRVNAYNTIEGPAAVFRDIPTRVQSIDDLRLPPVLKRFAGFSKGLVLVTGPTGSGRSTTLAAMINHINENAQKHILTIEDPIEFVHKSLRCLINQRDVGTHTHSFASALRSALREDPDVILVGELRDLETIHLALTAAETGHLVFGTLHTSSAAKTIDRIIDVFPQGDKEMARTMLSSSLEAVITQLLVKTSDNKGRVPLHEIMVVTPAIRNLIRDNKIPQVYSIMQVSSKAGMRTMKDSVHELFDESVISKDTARMVLQLSDHASDDEKVGGGF